MIHVAVVDDDAEERRRIKEYLDGISAKRGIEFSVREFTDGSSFIGTYTPEYDIVLMDIEMPGMNGLESARQLRSLDTAVIIIFVTRMANLAAKGYEVDALDFIVKPIDSYAFSLKISRALSRVASSADKILLRIDGEIRCIKANTLRYIETDGHYVIYHTSDGTLKEYASLKSVEKKSGPQFCALQQLLSRQFAIRYQRTQEFRYRRRRRTADEPSEKTFFSGSSYIVCRGGVNNLWEIWETYISFWK